MKLEPDCIVTLKFVAFTVIDSIVALEPDTLSVMPFTLKTVLVVSVTSLYAAKAMAGANSPNAVMAARIFFIRSKRYRP